jgi:hypothetical protein
MERALMRSIGLLAFITMAPCSGEDANGNHGVWGIGQSSCHSYNKAREGGDYNGYKVYLMGYLTAYNSLIPDTYNITGTTDLNGVLAWLDRYCKKTAIDSYEHALKQMVTEMHETRMKKATGGPEWGRPR